MNVSASIQNASTCSDSRIHSARKTSRSKRTWSVSVGVKAVKSCVPNSASAQASQRVQVQRPRLRAARSARSNGDATGAAKDAVAIRPRQRVAPRVEAVRRRPPTPAPGCPAAAARSARATGAGSPACDATCPRAWTPASVRPATVRRRLSTPDRPERASRARPGPCAAPGCARPARESGPVVFEKEPGGQTSSRKTISVASERRGPSFRILV